MKPAVREAPGALPAPAAAFEFVVVWAIAALAFVFAREASVGTDDWRAFAVLVPVIAGAHLLAHEREKHQGSHLSLAPMFAAVLLLPPLLAAAAIAVAFVPEWARTRVSWYIALFNIANFVGPALAARAAFEAFGSTTVDTAWALAAVAAAGIFLALQYAVLAVMLKLARGISVRETMRLDCVLIDAGLLSLGAAGAALAEVDGMLAALLVLPLALLYRSLAIPRLLEATRIEPKTGLFNVRHFQAALEQELARAARFDRPLSLAMVDVDHLRQINNVHGHLAGDRALGVVAETLRAATRDYDVAARFGGDEFTVLLPETGTDGALVVAERVRAGVERAAAGLGFLLTVSIGVSTAIGPEATAEELVGLADRAAYRAKFSGRNAVALAPDGDPVREAEQLLAEA
jgi:diguanylate cyclase (GGDEF)-like protein